MPCGLFYDSNSNADSITNGWRSSDGNGYRLDLLNALSPNTIQYIGSVQAGTMADNHCEGHNGAVISQIASFANLSLPERPNVVLLMAGTNDMNIPTDPDTAPNRLGSLIDQITIACPDAAVLVAQLIHSGNAGTNDRIATYNNALVGVVAQRQKHGRHVLLAEGMSSALSEGDYNDTLHPNDSGYQKIANTWYSYLNIANNNGWINEPIAAASNGSIPGSINDTAIAQTTSSAPSTVMAQPSVSTSLISATISTTTSFIATSTYTPTPGASTANAAPNIPQPFLSFGFVGLLFTLFL